MEFILPLATLAAVQLLAVISPGQSFVVISKLALSDNRPAAISAALGMGLGSVIWASAALLGVAFILEQAAWLFALMKLAGGAYLVFLALSIWRHAAEPMADVTGNGGATGLGRGFGLGLLTQLANPKVMVFFGSIFFALLPADPAPWVYGAALAIVFLNETIWYSLVAVAFSVGRARRVYAGVKTVTDRLMAGALGLIGGRLVFDGLLGAADRG